MRVVELLFVIFVVIHFTEQPSAKRVSQHGVLLRAAFSIRVL